MANRSISAQNPTIVHRLLRTYRELYKSSFGISAHIRKKSTSLLRICVFTQIILSLKTLLSQITIRNFSACTQTFPRLFEYLAQNPTTMVCRILPRPRVCVCGGGGGTLIFFFIRRPGPSIYHSPKIYQEFQAPKKKIEILATPQNIPILCLDLRKRS